MDYDAPYAYDSTAEYDSAIAPVPVGGTKLYGDVGIRPLLGGGAGSRELMEGYVGLDALGGE